MSTTTTFSEIYNKHIEDLQSRHVEEIEIAREIQRVREFARGTPEINLGDPVGVNPAWRDESGQQCQIVIVDY